MSELESWVFRRKGVGVTSEKRNFVGRRELVYGVLCVSFFFSCRFDGFYYDNGEMEGFFFMFVVIVSLDFFIGYLILYVEKKSNLKNKNKIW